MQVRIRADGRVKNFGRVSGVGESTFCEGASRSEQPLRESFAVDALSSSLSLSLSLSLSSSYYVSNVCAATTIYLAASC